MDSRLVFWMAGSAFTVYRTSLLYQCIKCWDGKQIANTEADRIVETIVRHVMHGSPLSGMATQKMVNGVLSLFNDIDNATKAGSMYGGLE